MRSALAWVLAGMTLLFGSLYASSDRLAALVPPDNLYADALWIGEIDRVTQYRLDASAVWLSLSQAARALAVDPAGVLWVYGEGLSTYNFQGQLQGTVSPGPDNSSKALLTVNANTGDAWLGLGTRLQRFRADRTLATTLTLPSKAIQLAYDSSSDRLWVATADAVTVRDANGTVLLQLPLNPTNTVRSLALAGTGQAWVNDGQTLSLYSSLGQLLRRLPRPNADQVITGPTDTLWITAGRRLLLLDALTGVEHRSLDPFAQGSTIDLLAANPVDGSAFVTQDKVIVQIAADGSRVRTLNQVGKVRALTVYADLTAPTLNLTAPAPASLTRNNRPAVRAAFTDAATGVDTASLFLLDNDAALGLDCTFTASSADCVPRTVLADGPHALAATIKDLAGNQSAPARVEFSVDTQAPVITLDLPGGAAITNQASFTLAGSLSEIGSLNLDGAPLALDAARHFSHGVTLVEGENTYHFAATDPAGNTGTATAYITLDTQPPPLPESSQIQVSAPADGTVTVTGAVSSVEPGAILVVTNSRTGETVTVTANPDGSFFALIGAQPGDILELQLHDAAGNQSAIRPFPVSGPGNLPPDPATVATPLSETAITPLVESTAFLYSGPAPIQTGVAAGTIDPIRAAVIRGRVLDKDNQPLAGVTITIKDHPEYGQTLSRADGAFDLALNGGGLLTLNYEKAGYLPVQRQVQTPWHDYVAAQDIVLIALDPLVTTVDLTADTPMQIAQGSPMTDADGSRQATVFFPQGTAASLTLPDGSTQPLTNLHVRATEYTVGSNGPQAMPGPLPATSGYTYAVELSVDEAVTAGATRVDFSQPLPVYVDNFLNFPVGEVVPVGWYDREKAAWIPADNGKVIKILGIDASGLAALDTDGSGLVADSTKLAALGITAAEQTQLASLYPAGKTLWRVQVTHFTPWDCNWPWGPPPDSTPPPPPEDGDQPPPDQDSDPCKGCDINAQARTLGEELAIAGTPYKLHYQSRRTAGYKAGRIIDIRVSGASVPASLKGIDLTVVVAGQTFTQSFPPVANQSYPFTWDGLDAYGRTVTGGAEATITLNYRYNLVYYAARSDFERSFALISGGGTAGGTGGAGLTVLGNRLASTIVSTRTWQQTLTADSTTISPLAGWNLSVHHSYDPIHRKLTLGNGELRDAADAGEVITTAAGNGSTEYGYDGNYTPATLVALKRPKGVALDPEGNLYIADTENHRIRRVGPDGINITVAGNFGHGYASSQDGLQAAQAMLNFPEDVAIGRDGSIYIADTENSLVRRVGPDGIITKVAGVRYIGSLGIYTGAGYSGDGGPAITAALTKPTGLAMGPDGSLYIADSGNRRIRRIGPDGIITTVAGSAGVGYSGDGGPATRATLSSPNDIAVGPDGSLYIADTNNSRIRRVGPDGIITTVAGNGTYGYSGDGGPANQAALYGPKSIALGPDGNLYIGDTGDTYSGAGGNRIRRVGPDGIITTVAGTGQNGFSGDGGPATQGKLKNPWDVAVGPDGSLYIADAYNNRIRKATLYSSAFGSDDSFIPSDDGREFYQFDPTGRHLRTLNALTGAEIYRFTYDASGRLTGITDGDSNLTSIERAGDGSPAAIIAPDGQRTNLMLDAQGYLASVANPAGEAHTMTYTPDRLLATFTDPKGQANRFTYDAAGRLMQDTNAGGGGWTITTTERPGGYTNTLTSGEGRARQFGVDYLPTGERVQTNTHTDGTVQTTRFKPDRYEATVTAADGTVTTSAEGPDPRFGMQSPVPKTRTLRLPSGLGASIATTRTATRSDLNDLLSLSVQTETTTLNGRAYTQMFDRAALTRTATSPLGRSVTTTVDLQGRPVQRAIPGLALLALAYDIRGRLVSAVQSDGTDTRSASLGYYASGPSQGYLASLTDALGRTRSFDYDSAGRVTTETLPGGRTIAYAYDANGNLTSIAPPGQPPHRFDYTALDQTQAYSPPPVATFDPATRYTYNRDKQLTRISRPDGQVIDFAYDAGGRASAVVTPTRRVDFGYDAISGNLISLATALGVTHSYAWDGFLLTGETLAGPVSGSLGRTYNSDFNLTGLSVNGSTIAFAYDNDRLLTQAGALTLSRDPQNGLITGTTLGSLGTMQGYNPFGELTAFSSSYAGTGLLSTAYTHDSLGRITQKTETLAGITTTDQYAYDAAGRLAEVQRNGIATATYGYDANGNRTQVNGTAIASYDAQDRLLTYGTNSYSYTANGELNTKTAGSLTTTYTYDVLGNLTQTTLPNGTAIDYVIDGNNRRIGKKVNGVLAQGFLYQDQLRIAAELDGSNRVVSRFVYGTRPNVPEYLIKGADIYRIITDHLGSVRLVVNTANGSIIQRMDYGSFGNVTADTNPGFQPFGFAGGLYDRDTKLTRFGARDYDAETGRWTAKDPIGFGGGDANIYAYVASNPLNIIDPLGLSKAVVDRGSGTVAVNLSNGESVTYPAGNNTTNPSGDPNVKGSNGPAPAGVWPVQAPVNTSGDVRYGPYFWPIGAVDGQGNRADIARQRGIGLHGGRSSHRSRTQGCVRMDNADVLDLYERTINDPLISIEIR